MDLTQFKLEVCQLVSAVTGSQRVCWRTQHKKKKTLISEVCTLGYMGQLDMKFDLPILGENRKFLLAPNAKKIPELASYPGDELVANFKSVAANLIYENDEQKSYFVAWNPSDAFFRNETAISTIQRIALACRRLFEAQSVDASTKLIDFVLPAEPELRETGSLFHAEPLSHFLFDTLLKKQRLLARNGVTYLAVRKWRTSIKEYQIDAVQALKRENCATIAQPIGNEIVETIVGMYGKTFDAVVPVPGGSSQLEHCLSVHIGRVVASTLNLPFSNVLTGCAVKPGKSHPKKSATLSAYTLNGSIHGKVLLVDDVATSGRHIELAVKALRPHTEFVGAIAWIGA